MGGGGHACIYVANIGMGGMHVYVWLILVWGGGHACICVANIGMGGACMYLCG